MKEESLRLKKVNELIRKKIGEIFEKELSFKTGILVTIAKVRTSPDLRHANVSVSVFPIGESSYVLETLKKEMYAIQGSLNRQLNMRPLPRVSFELDYTEEKAQIVDDLLKEI